MEALEAASDFRRVPGSDSWVPENWFGFGAPKEDGMCIDHLGNCKGCSVKAPWVSFSAGPGLWQDEVGGEPQPATGSGRPASAGGSSSL